MRWGGLQLHTDYEFPNNSQDEAWFPCKYASVLPRSPEPEREGKRLASLSQQNQPAFTPAPTPSGLRKAWPSGETGGIVQQSWQLLRDPSGGESSPKRSRARMPATKSLGMGRQPRAGIAGMLPFLTGLAGPSAWHPGATRPCPPCTGGCPGPGPWSPLDPCTQEKERLGRAFSPHPCDSVMSLFLEQTLPKLRPWEATLDPEPGPLSPQGQPAFQGMARLGPELPLEGQALPKGARLGGGTCQGPDSTAPQGEC